MPLLPAVTLTGKWNVAHDGETDTGPLVADERGIGVDVTKRSGLTKKITRRFYLVGWDDVTSIDIAQPETVNLGGTTINAHTVMLTVDTADRHLAFKLKHTNQASVHNQLGTYIARVKARS